MRKRTELAIPTTAMARLVVFTAAVLSSFALATVQERKPEAAQQKEPSMHAEAPITELITFRVLGLMKTKSGAT